MTLATFFWSEPETVKQSIPPIFHTDGTVEVALINSGSDGTPGTSDDENWALRFPAGLDVSTPDPTVRTTLPAYSGNTVASINFALPGFEFGAGQFDIDPANRLRVTLAELHNTVSDPFFAMKIDPTNVPSQRQQPFESCFMARSVRPGLFELLNKPVGDPNEQVLLTDILTAEHFFLPPSCLSPRAEMSRKYVVTGPNGAPLGYGHCPIDEPIEALNTCQFRIWLPMQREATLNFKPEYIGEVPEIAQFIRGFVVDATDFEASQNIEIKE